MNSIQDHTIQLKENNRISAFWSVQLFSALKRKFSNHTQRNTLFGG